LARRLANPQRDQTGIDYRDSAYVINAKSTRTLRENMVFNLALGFANIPDPQKKSKTYAMVIEVLQRL
jgi:nucleosome binding factor SPN SPT16 subunit